MPKDKKAILGVISSKLGKLEDMDALVARVKEAASYMGENGLDRLGVSPQCGFASHSEGNDIGRSDQDAKLKLTVDLANKIWPSQ